MKTIKISCTLAAMLMCFTSSTHAAVLIDFTNVASSAGAINTFSGTTTILNDTTNTASGISLSSTAVISKSTSTTLYAQAASGDVAAAGFTLAMGQSANYLNGTNTTSYTFSGLTVGQNYDFTLWGSRNVSGQTRISAYDLTGGVSAVSDTLLTNPGTTSPYSNDSNVVVLSAAPTGTTLTLTLAGVAGDYAYLNAARIDTAAVPEPSSAALLGLGGIALLFRRRK